ncbi:MAG: dipeptide epimerase [Elusimicrobia bacterium]|nr:dipeptide epimerase [Elusimicrobiota bacterium]
MRGTIITKTSVKDFNGALFQPFVISRGSSTSLANLLLTVKLADGTCGYGEAAAASYAGETREKTSRNLEKTAQWLEGKDVADYTGLFFELEQRLETNRSALACVEIALLDALGKTLGIPFWKFFGRKLSPIKTDITVVIGTAAQAEEFTLRMLKKGLNAFKIKIGVDYDEDFKRITIVKKAAPKSRIYLDANCAYDADTGLKFFKKIFSAGIIPQVIEQPVEKEDYDGLKFLTKKLSVPVCADESAYSVDDAVKILKNGYASAINIKLMKLGILRAREIYFLAKSKNVKLMMGEMLESEISSLAAAHFAGGLGDFDFIDLDTPLFIKDRLTKGWNGLCLDGTYNLSAIKQGLGVSPASAKATASYPA